MRVSDCVGCTQSGRIHERSELSSWVVRIIYNAANFQPAGKASHIFGGNIRMIERRVMQEYCGAVVYMSLCFDDESALSPLTLTCDAFNPKGIHDLEASRMLHIRDCSMFLILLLLRRVTSTMQTCRLYTEAGEPSCSDSIVNDG